MQGIAGGLEVLGHGTVRYQVLDNKGRVKELEGPGLLIKDLPVRLVPPQSAMPTDTDGHYRINGTGGRFIFSADGGEAITPLDLLSNLPTLVAFHDVNQAAVALHQSMYSCVSAKTNQNLSPSQKERMQRH